MHKDDVLDQILTFLETRFEINFGDEDNFLTYDTDLFETGYIDSLESLAIINFLEKNFKISISPNDLIETPINCVNQMVAFVANAVNPI